MMNRIFFTARVESTAPRACGLTPVRRQLTAAWQRNPDTGRLELQWSKPAVDRATESHHLGAAPLEPPSRLAA
jgi:hypothetical protein